MADADVLPFATVVIPARNESRTLIDCLHAILAQDYPRERFEVLLLDGLSQDDTRAVAESYAEKHGLPLRVIPNPGRSVPAALNVALDEARGGRFVRVDGHSAPAPDYLRRCVAGNDRFDADLAGGWVRAVGKTPVGRAVAVAFASPFSMGNASSWSPPEAATEVASVPCGSYRIEALRKIGGFDEGQLANQDYEANYRLRLAGGRCVLLPEVWFDYETRGSFRRLSKQFFRYGWFKARTMVKHPHSTRPRHLVPAGGLVVLVLLAVGSLFSTPALVVLLVLFVLYALVLAFAAFRADGERMLLPPVLTTMHVSWALGNVLGLIRWLPTARRLRQAPSPAQGLAERSR
jgi:succinoglycan biosynthesis protein ExoA